MLTTESAIYRIGSSPRSAAGVQHLTSLSQPLFEIVETGVTPAGLAAPLQPADELAVWRGWRQIIEQKLLVWSRDPQQLRDEGIEAPSLQILRTAIRLSVVLRDDGYPPPDSVVPDANGGIVFEYGNGEESEAIHVWDDGTIEWFGFRGTKITRRNRVYLGG